VKKPDKNTRVLFVLAIVIGLMIGIVSQAAPLYRMFCGATGLNGTTQRTDASPAQTKERYVTILFDGNVEPALPWDFGPDVRSIRVKLGEVANVSFHAHNRGDKTVVGTAVHNVQPDKAGLYFDKLQCFCFTRQVLKPGQTVELPVQFFVDPAIADNVNDNDVSEITLSYTFFLAKDQDKAQTIKQATTVINSTSNP
jgi:cytochrome c oxidase assembly protein subunit 11